MIGTCINDRYRVDAELGQGGMGVVYRAHDTLLDRAVAVKVVSKASLGTEGRVRLMHEAKAAAQLNHPNVVSVFDAGESEGQPFIVMELVEGQTLHDLRPTELDEIVSYARQICAALEHAHAHGIVHRDLKPENVQIAPDGTAKLGDFGLARSVASRITSEGTIVGSVFYLAPELALGQESDGRADLYALGVMLYELTTGRLPFVGDDPVAVISQHLHAPVVPPRAKNEQIPPALDALILRLLGKDSQDRPASAADVLRELERPGLLDMDAIPARELSVLERIERGRLVGRERELQRAGALWSRALDGEGQVLLISGEPGIGKTRLVREVMTQVQVWGGRGLVGASYAEGGTPYAPFRQMIRGVVRGGPGQSVDVPQSVWADVLTLAPELRSRLQDVPPNPSLNPEEEQQRLLENVLIFFTALSDRVPLLLVLEDVHWADSGSLFLLRHLARNSRRQRLMIIATYRELELDEARPFHQMLLDLTREHLAIRLKLPRLNRAQTAELLDVLFAGQTTPDLVAGVYRETEGNPFFIEEVCKALAESGKLGFAGGRWQWPGIDELGIPQSVRIAIQSRVASLPEPVQQTLCLAAVLGRQFDVQTLTAASELQETAVIDALETAERAQLIAEVPAEKGSAFSFVHGLIGATLVEGLRTLQLRGLHARVAAAIEEQRADDFEALAYHYVQAGLAPKATTYLLKAGDRARSLYAHQEAIDHYLQALDFAEGAGLQLRARTWMRLGLTYHNAFQFSAARQAYEKGFALWQQVGETQRQPDAAPAPHALRLSWSNPLTLDPSMAADGASAAVIEELFDGLVNRSPEMEVIPAVARSWEVLEGGTRYVFHLRGDVLWSDGVQLTAGDFEYAWRRVLDPVAGSPHASFLYDVAGSRAFHEGQASWDDVGVRAADERTLVVDLEGPRGHFLQLLANVPTYPLPRHKVERLGTAWAALGNVVNNGPFVLQEWKSGESMTFDRNPRYYGRREGNVQRVQLSLLAEPESALELYEQDQLDIVGLSPAVINRARHLHAGEYISLPSPSTYYLAFDVRHPPFDNLRVRRAFSLATDKEGLADVAQRGFSFPAAGGLVPPGVPGHSSDRGLPYDPEAARQLLAEAGFPGGGGFPTVTVVASASSLMDAQFLQARWRETLGVEVGLETAKTAGDPPRSAQSADMMFRGWHADYPDPDNFLRVGFPWQLTGWRNAAYEGLLEDAQRMMDQSERMKTYQRADRLLIAEAPIVPLAYGSWHLLVKPWVRQFPMSSIKLWFWKDVIIEPH